MRADSGERRRIIGIAAVLGVLLLLAVLVGPGAGGDPTLDPRMSSYLTTDAGVRGLYLALEELGQPVIRHRLPVAPDDPPGALLLLAPEHPPDSAGTVRMREWVEDGGFLVLGLPRASGSLNRLLGPALPLRMVDSSEGVTAYPTQRGGAHPWLDGVDSIPGIRRVLDVVMEEGDGAGVLPDDPATAAGDASPLGGSPRDAFPLDAFPLDAFPLDAFPLDATPLDASPPDGTPTSDTVPAPLTVPFSEVEVLMVTADGRPVVATWSLGEGRVLVLSDPSPLGNLPLQESGADAATLVVRTVVGALDGATGGQVRFDEYSQGFRGDGSPARAVADFLTGSGPGRWLLQGLIAALLLVMLAARRFGAPIAEVEARGRTPLEHMEALATVYRKAGARGTVRRRLVSGLERRLGRKVVVDGRMELAPALREGEAGRRLVAEWEKGERMELDALARAMDDLIAEVKG